jgi:hypothetical protein
LTDVAFGAALRKGTKTSKRAKRAKGASSADNVFIQSSNRFLKSISLVNQVEIETHGIVATIVLISVTAKDIAGHFYLLP